ncbi:hypothetical protein ACUXE6_001192 [Staphylococcus epidermidis]
MKSSVRLLNHIIKIMNLQQSLIIRDEQWNQSYEAYNFNINGYVFKSRLAKKTTKKKGYFYRFGKKIKQRKIEHLTMSHFLGN